jgi:hypothetical protein
MWWAKRRRVFSLLSGDTLYSPQKDNKNQLNSKEEKRLGGLKEGKRERERLVLPLSSYRKRLLYFCPSRRGWGICPARARPSWIIRGACPLHDPTGVRKKGRNVYKGDKK